MRIFELLVHINYITF